MEGGCAQAGRGVLASGRSYWTHEEARVGRRHLLYTSPQKRALYLHLWVLLLGKFSERRLMCEGSNLPGRPSCQLELNPDLIGSVRWGYV